MSALRASAVALAKRYDVALLDLDGVVYVGPRAVAGAAESLAHARAAGMRLAFVTNNAARTPQAVATHLGELGVPARAEDVITSAQTAAHHLARHLPAGAPVLVVGTTGLVEALREQGLTPVYRAEDSPVAVVQGYSPDLDWRQLAEGAVAIRAGAEWVATNLDVTVPSPRGPLPGNGALVGALRLATGVEPTATGKPDPRMHRETVERSGAVRPLVVGDRLDTDIEGAKRVGCDSLLVLTGVTDAKTLLRAASPHRPTYVDTDLRGLLGPQPEVTVTDRDATCGSWRAAIDGDRVVLSHRGGDQGATDLDALRATCGAVWSWRDTQAGSDRQPQVTAGDADAAARATLHRLGLE